MHITDDELDERLHKWAEWASFNQVNIGYPSSSPLNWFREKGLVKSTPGARIPGAKNDTAEEMEKAVCALHQQSPRLAKALCYFYLNPNTTYSKLIYDFKRQFNIDLSIRRFKEYVHQAKEQLKMYFAGKEKNNFFLEKKIANY